MKLDSIEKDKQPSVEILRLFEKTRVAYLSAKEDPKEYRGRWQNAVDMIIESYEKLNAVGKELKRFIEEEDLKNKDTKNPESLKAQKLFEDIKLLRYSSKIVFPFLIELSCLSITKNIYNGNLKKYALRYSNCKSQLVMSS